MEGSPHPPQNNGSLVPYSNGSNGNNGHSSISESTLHSTIQDYLEQNIEQHLFSIVDMYNVDYFPPQTYQRKKYASHLNSHERNLIAELQGAISHFEDETSLEIVGETTNLYDILNLPAVYIRRIIKFCKNIPAFRQLSSEDQVTILKGFAFEILAVRFMFIYDNERDGHAILAVRARSGLLTIPW